MSAFLKAVNSIYNHHEEFLKVVFAVYSTASDLEGGSLQP
jgi:hypothetical protein